MGALSDFDQLLGQLEGQYFDRKSLWHGPTDRRRPRDRREVRDQIVEYVAAFANADGGMLVLGIKDDSTLTGHGYPPDVVEQMLAVPQQRLTPPQPRGRVEEYRGLQLIIFEVPEAESAVMVHGDGFPRRVHDTVIAESEEAINAIKRRGARYRVIIPGKDVARPTPRRALEVRMREQGHIKNVDYREAFDVDRSQALRALSELVGREVLVQGGERRGTHYTPGPAWSVWIASDAHSAS